MNLLSITKLRREYERGGRTFAAVDNATFFLEQGEFVSIIGRSGSGKTTLVSMAAGLVTPTDGEILLDGNDISTLGDEALSRLRNKIVGYIPQGASLLPSLTALENVRLPLYLAGGEYPADSESRALELLHHMGVDHLRDAYPADLSGGEMRRVAIARALINGPKLIIADEPTSDLDEESAGEVMRLLSSAHRGGHGASRGDARYGSRRHRGQGDDHERGQACSRLRAHLRARNRRLFHSGGNLAFGMISGALFRPPSFFQGFADIADHFRQGLQTTAR